MLDVTFSPMESLDLVWFHDFARKHGLFDMDKPWLAFFVLRKGVRIGGCYLCEIEAGEAEFGVWIDDPGPRRGYGALAAKKLIRAAFDGLGLNRIRARCLEGDETALRPLRRAGFKVDRMQDEVLLDGTKRRLVFLSASRDDLKGVL